MIPLAIVILIGALVGSAFLGVHFLHITWVEIYQTWIPKAITPVFAGIFLAVLVPWANHFYWKRRTENERKWHVEKVKGEIVSNIAELLEGAFLNIDRLAELDSEEPTINCDFCVEYKKERYLIHRAKLEAEKGIGKMLRLIEIYYSEDVVSKMNEWIEAYNASRDNHIRLKHDDPLVSKASDLMKKMRVELDCD